MPQRRQHSNPDDRQKFRGRNPDRAQGSQRRNPHEARKPNVTSDWDDESVCFDWDDVRETSGPVPKIETGVSPWNCGKLDKLYMVYVSGDNPWEFYLGYKNDRRQVQSLEEAIEDKYTKGLLEKSLPIVGKLVVCRSTAQNRLEYFRGLIVKYNPKTRGGIRNVVAYKLDYGNTATLFPDDLYCLPLDLASIPSRVVKCCILDDEHHLKEKFCKELRLAFKDVLRNSVLTVDLGKHDESQPPCFSAVVWTFDADKCVADVNLNLWINGKVIPRLKEIPPEETNVFLYLREQEIMDPYYDAAGDTDVAAADEPPSITIPSVDAKRAVNGVRSSPSAGETDVFASLQELADKIVPFNYVEPANVAFDCPAVGESDVVPALRRAGKIPPLSNTKLPKHDLISRRAAPKCTATDSTTGSRFVPPGLVVVANGNNEENFDGIIANLQEEYQPTDERRICLFYQKHGFCGRKLCRKEHVEKSSLWTTDTIPTYVSVFNDVCLPGVGSEVLLKILHLNSPVSFYVSLPDSFSDTGEPGVLETSATLHADLNSLESNNTHPLLPVVPMETELVIALGQQDSLGPRKKWLRAQVREFVSDTHVEVFFLDFGNKEVVKIKDLRAMRPRFLHLPAQAVLTRLHKLVATPEKKEVALQFLNITIMQKDLKAKVVSEHDGELDVIIHLENGVCLNDLLVSQNLAYRM